MWHFFSSPLSFCFAYALFCLHPAITVFIRFLHKVLCCECVFHRGTTSSSSVPAINTVAFIMGAVFSYTDSWNGESSLCVISVCDPCMLLSHLASSLDRCPCKSAELMSLKRWFILILFCVISFDFMLFIFQHTLCFRSRERERKRTRERECSQLC